MRVNKITARIPVQVKKEDLVNYEHLYTEEARREAECLPQGKHHLKSSPYRVLIDGSLRFHRYRSGVLGSGHFGTTTLAQDHSGKWYALKAQFASEQGSIIFSEKLIKHIMRENINLTRLNRAIRNNNHQHVELFQYSDKKHAQRHFLPMELAYGESLRKFTDPTVTLHPVQWMEMVVALVKAVREIHQHGMLHRDIKPENFVFDKVSGSAKLVDVGLASLLNKHGVINDKVCGTLNYMDRAMRHKFKSDESAILDTSFDIYGLGKTIEEILLTKTKNQLRVIKNIKLQSDIDAFLSKMTDEQSQDRPKLNEVENFFDKLLKQTLEESEEMKIAMFDTMVLFFFNAQQMSVVLSSLQEYDKVFICDLTDLQDNYLAKTIHMFETAKINVSDIVLHADDDLFAQSRQVINNIYSRASFTTISGDFFSKQIEMHESGFFSAPKRRKINETVDEVSPETPKPQ